MRRSAAGWLVLLGTTLPALMNAAPARDFALVKNHQPAAVIVRSADSTKTLESHIQFFNTELKRCAKTDLPVVKEAKKNQNRIIFRLEKRPVLQQDAYAIDFPDSQTMRITGTEDSVRWALNHLLEKEIGIRWLLPPLHGFYGPEINHYPQLKNVSVRAEKFADRPAVPFSRSADWRINPRCWNGLNRHRIVHGISIDVFPVYKYAVDGSWPQAIMPVINGKKLVMKKAKAPLPKNFYLAQRGYNAGWQPCWSNPETARIAIENILEILKNDPSRKTINLDVNDNGGYCECANCRKAVGGKVNLSGFADYSELYWKWANTVADAVTKQYPDVIFNAIAYCNVLNPPSFKLNPHILPQLCLELPTLLDPVWREKRLRLIRAWCEKTEMLDLYDYMHGVERFLLPRIYFKSHSRILAEMVRKYQLRSAFFESDGRTAFQGPQQQLMLRVLWNPELDVEAFLKDWCEHAVGKKAAPFLQEYYRLWEDYWTGENIRKTAWYSSIRNVYMQLGENNTHTYALKKGDLKKFRSLMEKVTALAETPEQKKRAQVLMQAYEFSELAATAAFSEIIPPEGRLRSANEALDLLNALPAAIQAGEKFRKHPLIKFEFARSRGQNMLTAATSSVGLVIPFLKDPRVRQLVKKYSDDRTIPFTLRAQFKIWLGAKTKNLIGNGSFEQETVPLSPLWMRGLNGKRDSRRASDGKYSFRTGNGYYILTPKMESNKNYLFLCDLYIEKGSGEGRFTYKLGACEGNTLRKWTSGINLVPSGGTWNTYSALVSYFSDKNLVDNLQIQLWFQKFESNEPVWIDNLRLYCLDDLVTEK